MAKGNRRKPGTSGTVPGTPRGSGDGANPPDRSRLGWVALAVAGVLAGWQVVYALTGPGSGGSDVYTSVWLLVSLVLAVGAMVLGLVALSQHAVPRWPATAALAIGGYAFVVSVATWIGDVVVRVG